MKLEIHLKDEPHTIVDNVATFWQSETYLHVRTLFGNYPEERMYARKNIIAIFEVKDDGRKEII